MYAYMDLQTLSQATSMQTLVHAFMPKPLPFVYKWTMLRRGADISYSPIGYLCAEGSLREVDAFFR